MAQRRREREQELSQRDEAALDPANMSLASGGFFSRVGSVVKSLFAPGDTKAASAVSAISNILGPQAGGLAQVGAEVFNAFRGDPLMVKVPAGVRRIDTPMIGPPSPPTSGFDRAVSILSDVLAQPFASPSTPAALPPSPSSAPVQQPSGVQLRKLASGRTLITGVPGVKSAEVMNVSLASELAKIAQRIPQILRNPAVQGAAGAGAAEALMHGNGASALAGLFGGQRKRRRMNYGNARAARRAIRRIKGTRKLLQDIEKQLPRRPAPRARRDLGPGHTHVR